MPLRNPLHLHGFLALFVGVQQKHIYNQWSPTYTRWHRSTQDRLPVKQRQPWVDLLQGLHSKSPSEYLLVSKVSITVRCLQGSRLRTRLPVHDFLRETISVSVSLETSGINLSVRPAKTRTIKTSTDALYKFEIKVKPVSTLDISIFLPCRLVKVSK